MKKAKKIYIVTVILLIISIGYFYASYAFFNNTKEEHGKLNIVAGDLKYKLESDSLDNGKIVIGASETKEFIVNLTSLNEIDSKYELYYRLDTNNSDINVAYSSSSIDSVSGTIEAKGKKTITVKIENNGNTSSTVYIGVVGGLVNKKLVLGSGNNSLNKDTTISQNYLSSAVLANNTIITDQPTLSTSSNNSSDKSGLYKSIDTNSGNATYYFRGEVENNYVSFAGLIWRIIRINEDDTVRLILQDGINNNTGYSFNSLINDYKYMYYSNSNAKTELDSWYTTSIESNSEYSKYVVSGKYFCEQAKVRFDSSYSGNNASMVDYSSYTPSFKCSTDGNGYGLVDSNIGLITYDEIVFAGLYFGSANANNFLNNNRYVWTMSSIGYKNSGSIGVHIWPINNDGSIGYVLANSGGFIVLRPVINVRIDDPINGNGTKSNPYTLDKVWNFDYLGDEQSFEAPYSGTYKIETWGAQGGNYTFNNYAGGYGGYSSGQIYLDKGTKLFVNIGGKGANSSGTVGRVVGGYNGGGYGAESSFSHSGAGGGGATHIADRSGLLSTLENYKNSIYIVAGGGAGSAPWAKNPGSSGGGYKGNSTTSYSGTDILGGTQDSGYLFGQGGNGRIPDSYNTYGAEGTAGGGGGYYGGFAQTLSGQGTDGGAGGGSGYIGNSLLSNKTMYCYNCEESSEESTKTISTTCTSETPTENCSKQGNGYARITYLGD